MLAPASCAQLSPPFPLILFVFLITAKDPEGSVKSTACVYQNYTLAAMWRAENQAS